MRTTLVLLLLVACGPAVKEPEFPPYCYDRDRFTALIVKCTPDSSTREESRECKRKLNASCGFVETVGANAHEP
jgi:hypothetical protein